MNSYADTHNWLECIICGRQSVALSVDVETGVCDWCKPISHLRVIRDWASHDAQP